MIFDGEKTALVTGAASGIGKAIAKDLCANGIKVVINDVSEEALNATYNEFIQEGYSVDLHLADVSDEKQVVAMIDHISKNDFIDILVNNAGRSIKHEDNSKKTTLEISLDEWNFILANNLTSMFLCSKYVAERMVKKKSGKIVNISSILGKTGCAGDLMDNYHPISGTSGSHYCASKAGIISFTRSLARELAKFNINVNAVAPGAVSAGMGNFGGKVVERMKSQIPLGRLATQQEVADTVLFLCSKKSDYITGETINLNGGWFMD